MAIPSFDHAFLDELTAKAKLSDRLRAHHNIHESLEEACQRLFIAMEPDSYVVPHRHTNPAKPECFIGVRGRVLLFIFDDEGNVTEKLNIGPGQELFACDIPAHTWHTVISLETGTVFLEAKPGPYQPIDENDIAPWAPREGEDLCKPFLNKLLRTGVTAG